MESCGKWLKPNKLVNEVICLIISNGGRFISLVSSPPRIFLSSKRAKILLLW